ncbi:hypothetical protein TVAG_070530 [Trichomonas vaginalis G3]|uniref:Ribosomal protein L13 n=1 Tax=Trichomonas vaginalis (strain ATCC PRA-98 / G3) TaxID=412133 RepID=A2D7V7_TRIV3|nr:universal ribosomal protein uL13 family [Trichomonas vaginalis G3]EAY23390.1 hypothetical protein TVAG_070530 [Trichomonas vaginalis G3]KAI5493804.1 universal ribosomal protein uL13 family [Trichomonas vaginalis G3]|eukprot:XP_001584376.1 hypothetical protein [Trichomonas vaginalis G3]
MSASIVIDAKGHIQGRLAAAVAKQLLKGRKIVVVRAEEIVLNGKHKFTVHTYERFLNKTTNSNPRDGPFHQRAPREIFARAVRGMLPYKTHRGAEAFENLKVFEGVPAKYVTYKRVVIPHALRCVSIHTDRPTTKLGELSTTMGWKYGKVVADLEAKRKAESAKYYEAKKAQQDKKAAAIEKANKQLGAQAVKFLETFAE